MLIAIVFGALVAMAYAYVDFSKFTWALVQVFLLEAKIQLCLGINVPILNFNFKVIILCLRETLKRLKYFQSIYGHSL